MRTVPRNIGERIEFYKLHLAKWAENADQIGVSEEDITAMTELVEQANAAYKEQAMAQQKARMATQNLQIIQRKMNTYGQSMMLKVQATAKQEGNEIYPLASLPLPKQAAPIAEPGTPSDFKVEMDVAVGILTLTWKCDNPAGSTGTIYVVSRKDEQGNYRQLGIVGNKKKFVDDTLPKGTSQYAYRVQAVRGGKKGGVGNYYINFAFEGPDAARNQNPHQISLAA